MSKEEYIYQNFVFEDHPRDGEATYQSESHKTRLLKSRWEFVDETITTKGNNFVAILKMRKKKIFFELQKIKDFTKFLCSQHDREKDFKIFKECCDYTETHLKRLKEDFSKIEDNEELLYIALYCYHKLHQIVEKLENIERNLDNQKFTAYEMP